MLERKSNKKQNGKPSGSIYLTTSRAMDVCYHLCGLPFGDMTTGETATTLDIHEVLHQLRQKHAADVDSFVRQLTEKDEKILDLHIREQKLYRNLVRAEDNLERWQDIASTLREALIRHRVKITNVKRTLTKLVDSDATKYVEMVKFPRKLSRTTKKHLYKTKKQENRIRAKEDIQDDDDGKESTSDAHDTDSE